MFLHTICLWQSFWCHWQQLRFQQRNWPDLWPSDRPLPFSKHPKGFRQAQKGAAFCVLFRIDGPSNFKHQARWMSLSRMESLNDTSPIQLAQTSTGNTLVTITLLPPSRVLSFMISNRPARWFAVKPPRPNSSIISRWYLFSCFFLLARSVVLEALPAYSGKRSLTR